MADTVLTSEQLAALAKLHEDLGKLLTSLGGRSAGSGLFKRRALTSEQSRALMMERFNHERRQKV